ncbi:MAG: PadR family transcriptional regulator [Gemmatimonadota bacterium]
MAKRQLDLLQGTLDMLILKTLTLGQMHGYAIAREIRRATDGALSVEEGSLYPALHRMERRGWIEADWGLSENKRRAKYYRLTEAGMEQLETEVALWSEFTAAASKVLAAQPQSS